MSGTPHPPSAGRLAAEGSGSHAATAIDTGADEELTRLVARMRGYLNSLGFVPSDSAPENTGAPGYVVTFRREERPDVSQEFAIAFPEPGSLSECLRLAFAFLSALRRASESREWADECHRSALEAQAIALDVGKRARSAQDRSIRAHRALEHALGASRSCIPLDWIDSPQTRGLVLACLEPDSDDSASWQQVVSASSEAERRREQEAAAREAEAAARAESMAAFRDLQCALQESGCFEVCDGPEKAITYLLGVGRNISLGRWRWLSLTNEQATDWEWLVRKSSTEDAPTAIPLDVAAGTPEREPTLGPVPPPAQPAAAGSGGEPSEGTDGRTAVEQAAPPPAIDYESLATALRKDGKRNPAALVEYMATRKEATAQEIAQHVHGDSEASDSAMWNTAKRTSDALVAMGSPLSFRFASGRMFREISPK